MPKYSEQESTNTHRLITRDCVAELLGVNTRTLSNRKALRDIPDPILRAGAHPRWLLSEILEWLSTTDDQGRLLDADQWNAHKLKRR